MKCRTEDAGKALQRRSRIAQGRIFFAQDPKSERLAVGLFGSPRQA